MEAIETHGVAIPGQTGDLPDAGRCRPTGSRKRI